MNDLRRLLLCAFLLLPLAAGAQTATLVRDINQGDHDRSSELANIQDVTAVPGRVFFSATTGSAENRELWTSDGTAEGTFLLKDVCPGSCDSGGQVVGVLGPVLLWAGRIEDGSSALWRSDGTRAGTFRLFDAPIHLNGNPYDAGLPVSSVAGRFAYFRAVTDGRDGLWRTDGTRTGTQLVRALDAGQWIDTLLTDAGKVFLLVSQAPVSSGDTTWSVWTSDGTPPGTRQVRTLDRSRPQMPRVAGGHLFFIARNGTAGDELWASDGTAAGTRPVTDFVAPSPFGDAQDLRFYTAQVSGGRLFFLADDVVHGQELYVSDGTVAGTRRITDFGTAEPGFGALADLGSRVVFTAADDLGHSGVWTTTGDPASVRFLALPCGTDCRDSFPKLVKMGPRVVLFAGAAYGEKILSTDGTPEGTRLLRDGCPQDCSLTLPGNLPREAGLLHFIAGSGGALWRTDGTPAGTRKEVVLDGSFDARDFLEAAAGPFTLVFGSYRHAVALWALDPAGRGEPRLVAASATDGAGLYAANLVPFAGGLAFTGCDGDIFTLWRSAGTEASTLPAVPLQQPETPSYCASTVDAGDVASLGSSLVFLQRVPFSQNKALWRSDGTPAGTQQLTPEGVLILGRLGVAAGRVYFLALQSQTMSLWTSNGTLAGTTALAAWPNGQTIPRQLTVVGSELYFLAGDDGGEIWKSDGTPHGTTKVAGGSKPSSVPPGFTRIGPAIYFLWRGTALDNEIWRTDGTAAGTQSLGPVAGLGHNASPGELTAFQGSLYFIAYQSSSAVQALWRSDGTAAGTVPLAQFTSSPPMHQLTVAGDRLFFLAGDGSQSGGQGVELWESDGTAAGTHIVRDIRPGSGSAWPDHLTAAGGRLFFTAAEETYGRELWVSDGTAAGTRLVQDINPFGASSEPDQLTVAGDRLYFLADDGVSGRELWSLPLAGPAGCQPSAARLCLNNGRYQVEAAWSIEDSFGQTVQGRGTGVSLSVDTGYFWFFSPSNVEAVVKVLDGQGVNGHVWVFYGALSDIDYTLTVTDTQTGVTRRYHNPPGRLASVGDTHGFGPLGAYGASPEIFEAPPSPRPLVTARIDKAAAVPCQTGGPRLCLNDNRFAVEVAWKDFQGHTGKGTAVALTGDTGTFWFFNAANVELVVKVLDGRPVNGKLWLFYGALSNVEYTLTVTDTQTGTVRRYTNPSGRFASVADTGAF